MSDYNNRNDLDKRLKQDDIEQEKKANASTGMLIAAVLVIVGIIVGIYLYNRPAVKVQTVTQETTVQPAPVTTTTPKAVPATPTEATTPTTVNPDTTTTPADVSAPATSQ